MEQFESEHYIFHYDANTKAAQDISYIADYQERWFRHVCSVLGVCPDFKLEYFLCSTPEEVGHIYGDDDPCSGFADPPDKIYAVYNEQLQCIGFHEDAHIISYLVNRPECPAIREGLAMYFDRKWWEIQNLDWTGYYLKSGQYVPVNKLLNEDFFFKQNCAVSYPIMGAFTQWLISAYGQGKYIQMYRQQDIAAGMVQVYGKESAELGKVFADYVGLFSIDKTLEQRMAELTGGTHAEKA